MTAPQLAAMPDEIHPNSFLAKASREELVEHILANTEQGKADAQRYREVIRERDNALADRDCVLDLAAQYARLAGIEDPSRDAALLYAEEFREHLEVAGRTAEQQEGRRLGTLGVAMQLEDLAGGQRTFGGDLAALARLVAKALVDLNSAQHGPKKITELFTPPDLPQTVLWAGPDAPPTAGLPMLEMTW